jgi:Raf kinase inhibitor-like YbhB/YbcL family protein
VDGSQPAIPCDGKTAHVAYILLAEKTDSNGDSHNNGSYRMFLRVAQPGHGPLSIHEGENLNPVKTLRLRYDEWRKQQSDARLLGGSAQRGRGGVAAMTLTTTAWADGGRIPDKHAQPGHDVSPPLAWSGAPDNAASFVLIVHDLDAPSGNGTDDMLHWMVWNIPGSERALPEGVPQGASLPNGARQISATGPNYRGPAAAATGPPHHYVFELFALDVMLDVPAVGASPAQTRAAVVAAMTNHIRGKGVYVGTYRRPNQNP